MMDPVINVIVRLAQPRRPRQYRRYLSRLTRERITDLAMALEADAKKGPASLEDDVRTRLRRLAKEAR
jgi:hypothetical protein